MAIVTKVPKKRTWKCRVPKAKVTGKGAGKGDRYFGVKMKGSMGHLTYKGKPGQNFDPHGHGTNAVSKFRNDFYVKAYDAARSGLGMQGIAECLGVSKMTLKNWRTQNPDFDKAIRDGRMPDSKNGAKKAYIDYIYRRLPDDLKRYWNKLSKFEKMKNGYRKTELMLERAGENVRKWLFVHALVMNHFNASVASRKVLISARKLNEWKQDPNFVELLDHIYFMKKDFGEGKLMEKMSEGDVSCIIFFNKTINRDRGYDPRMTVTHEGGVEHTHKVTLEKIIDNIPLADRKRMLESFDQIGRKVTQEPRKVQALPAHEEDE